MMAQGPAGNCDTLGCVEPVSADGVGMALMLGTIALITLGGRD